MTDYNQNSWSCSTVSYALLPAGKVYVISTHSGWISSQTILQWLFLWLPVPGVLTTSLVLVSWRWFGLICTFLSVVFHWLIWDLCENWTDVSYFCFATFGPGMRIRWRWNLFELTVVFATDHSKAVVLVLFNLCITKTRLYNFDPLKPHF